jgi:hypothetical protein
VSSPETPTPTSTSKRFGLLLTIRSAEEVCAADTNS